MWRSAARLADELRPGAEGDALAVAARLQQLDYAWRLGMEREEMARLESEAEEIATRTGDLRSLALLQMLRSGRPGLDLHAEQWIAGVGEAVRLADESGDPHLRVAMRTAGSYAYLCAGDLKRFERAVEEQEEVSGGNRSLGVGIVIGSPVAWATMGRALALRERRRLDDGERAFERAIQIAEEDGDPETASWARSNLALLYWMRDEREAAAALARRNCELTERLGDVFSRSLALATLGATLLGGESPETAVEALEEAERTYRDAMGVGGEMEGWRGALRARALAEAGRSEEAVAVAERAVEFSRSHGMFWSLPLAYIGLARARAAAGLDGVAEALDEAEEIARETEAGTTLDAVERGRAELSAEPAG